jgi:hypothetical protein
MAENNENRLRNELETFEDVPDNIGTAELSLQKQRELSPLFKEIRIQTGRCECLSLEELCLLAYKTA